MDIESTNKATRDHALLVERMLRHIAAELIRRGESHDASKMESPEVEGFALYTDKLKTLTYGSEEYKACLREMQSTIDHHYANNRHHPEHWPNGISDMSLIDIVEMLCDWLAATKRHNDGDIEKSLIHNKIRFDIPTQLVDIFRVTVAELENSELASRPAFTYSSSSA